jgi:hypothetical protein
MPPGFIYQSQILNFRFPISLFREVRDAHEASGMHQENGEFRPTPDAVEGGRTALDPLSLGGLDFGRRANENRLQNEPPA